MNFASAHEFFPALRHFPGIKQGQHHAMLALFLVSQSSSFDN
jgi:hypothetical protein